MRRVPLVFIGLAITLSACTPATATPTVSAFGRSRRLPHVPSTTVADTPVTTPTTAPRTTVAPRSSTTAPAPTTTARPTTTAPANTVPGGSNPGTAANSWSAPFAANSIWNRPIGARATRVPAPISASAIGADPTLLVAENAANPLWTIRRSNGVWPPSPTDTGVGPMPATTAAVAGHLRLPADLTLPNQGGNSLVSVLSLDRSRWWSFGVCYADRGNLTLYCNTRDPQSSVGSPVDGDGALGMHGGSGLSSTVVIRPGELSSGIHHALALNVEAARWLSYASGGYRWPATNADGYANSSTYRGGLADLRMGSLLALPAGTTAASLGVTDPGAVAIVNALRDYGGYVVDDSAWDDVDLGVDAAAVAEFNRIPRAQVQALLGHLQVIADNGPGATAGAA